MPDNLQPITQVDATAFEKPEFQQSLNDFRVFLAEGDSCSATVRQNSATCSHRCSCPIPLVYSIFPSPVTRCAECTRQRAILSSSSTFRTAAGGVGTQYAFRAAVTT